MTGAIHNKFSVANFNCHAGIDGWGKPFDVLAATRSIDADVIVIAESFAEQGKGSIGRSVANDLGYGLIETDYGPARALRRTDGVHQRTWGPYLGRPSSRQSFAATQPGPQIETTVPAKVSRVTGTWKLSVLSRLPIITTREWDLPDLPREAVHRKLLGVSVSVLGTEAVIYATHLGHLLHGSPRQISVIRRHISRDTAPAVLVGDMNCWGPPLVAMLPGWRRAVRGRSWPAWRPHSQVDHVLVNQRMDVVAGGVLEFVGSDHRPVRATLRVHINKNESAPTTMPN